MGVISQNGIDYPVPSVPVQSDGSATDLTNAAVPTGQTIKSYLNSNISNLVKTATTTLAYSLAANEVKYYPLTAPADTAYYWYVINVLTGTSAAGANDYSNAGLRLKNNQTSVVTSNTATITWLGVKRP